MTESSNFLLVSRTEAFVDKSLLLKLIFQGKPFKIITAPSRFGKSTNLDMISRFLSITVDNKGVRCNNNRTEQHEIFKRLTIYRKEKRFFYENFGMFPVIEVIFKTNDPIKKCTEAVKTLKRRIHQSYRKHLDVCNSKYLNIEEKRLCEIWCDVKNYTTLSDEDVSFGLVYLAKLLYKHFDSTKVFVVIDEFDTLVTSVTFTANFEELACVLDLVTTQLLKIIKSVHVRGAIITGVSSIASLSLAGHSTKNLARYKFLEDHPLVEFYGFTEDEVIKLFQNSVFNLEQKEVKKARLMYSGYISKGSINIWCPYSVLKFLQEGQADTCWPPSLYVEHLLKAYRIPAIETAIDTLLKEKPVKMNFHCQIKPNDFLNLRKMISMNPYHVQVNTELFLLHILELGYLTFVTVSENYPSDTYVKLPNHETKQCILDYLWNIMVFSKLNYRIQQD